MGGEGEVWEIAPQFCSQGRESGAEGIPLKPSTRGPRLSSVEALRPRAPQASLREPSMLFQQL